MRDPAAEAAAAAAFAHLPPRPAPPALDTEEARSAWALEIAALLVALREAWSRAIRRKG